MEAKYVRYVKNEINSLELKIAHIQFEIDAKIDDLISLQKQVVSHKKTLERENIA